MSEPDSYSIQDLTNDAVGALRAENMDAALAHSNAILRKQPRHASALAVRFTALFNSGRTEEARRIGGEAARLNPSSEFILNNQACLQLDANQPAAAAALLKSLIEQYGEQPQWTYNLGLAQRRVGSLQKAISIFQRTIDLHPGHDRAVFQLAELYQLAGDCEMTGHQLNYLRLLRPNHALAHSHYMHYVASFGLLKNSDLLHEMRLWGRRFIPAQQAYTTHPTATARHTNFAFLIGDIPLAWWNSMVEPAVEALAQKDSVTVYWHHPAKLPSAAHADADLHYRDCRELSDADFAKQVRSDAIDVLIDVCGMRNGNRQRVLGLQVAARQFGWLAHEGMYASSRVQLLEPMLGSERFCIAPSLAGGETTTQDRNENSREPQQLLFALNCVNGVAKSVIQSWAMILHQLTGWRLHLDADRADIQNELRLRFMKHGISGERLSFDERLIPGNGSIVMENSLSNDVTRVHNALAHGARVLSLQGELFPAQQSAALLTQVGRSEWVCRDHASVQSKVLEMAAEPNLVGLQVNNLLDDSVHDIEAFADRLRTITTQPDEADPSAIKDL